MKKILIVDDRAIHREVLSVLLNEHGYAILEAEEGLQALERIRNNHTIDLIITDIAMPKMDGLTLVKELSEDPVLNKIPIIFYSATHKAAEAHQMAKASNVKYVLTKPCDPEIILGTIEGVLDPTSQFFNAPKMKPFENEKKEKRESLENMNMRLTNIIEIGLDMSVENDVEKLIYILCKSGRQFLQASYAGILLKDPKDPFCYKHFFISEENKLEINVINTRDFSTTLQEFFLSEKIICSHSPILDIEKLGLKDVTLPFSSLLSLPLKTNKAMYGKMYFINKKDRKIFTLSDQRFMMTLTVKFSVNYENRITEEKLRIYRQQMAEIMRTNSLGEMASSLAHEINQPLAAIAAYIKGCINRLENKKEVTPEILQVLNETSLQAKRAGEVIHRIKNFVRKGELFFEATDVNTTIEQSIQLIHQETQNSTLKIIYLPNPCLPLVDIDKIQIQQVILNLLRNAVESMKEANVTDPQITINVQLKNKTRITVNIIDNGPGFSEQTADHLFELYFTTKSQGMGLGLAICRSVIEAHLGQITAFVLPQGGSCFQFDLPVKNRSKKATDLLTEKLL